MSLEQINQRIAQVNEESKRINNERQISIGKKETLTQQLNEALEGYSKKYGVSITPETLDAEINRVMQLKQVELENVEKVLGLINEGKYGEAEILVNPSSQEQQVQHEEPKPAPVPESVPQYALPPNINSGVSNLSMPPQIPTPPSNMNLTGLDATQDARPVAPPPVFNKPTQQLSGLDMPAGTPAKNVTSDVTSFSAIIGGTAFAPDKN